MSIDAGPLEFSEGGAAWFLRQLLNGDAAMAMTLGHVVIGKSKDAPDLARDHELVHVWQRERWGRFCGPVYLGWSFLLWLRGDDAAGTIYLKKKHAVMSEMFRPEVAQ